MQLRLIASGRFLSQRGCVVQHYQLWPNWEEKKQRILSDRNKQEVDPNERSHTFQTAEQFVQRENNWSNRDRYWDKAQTEVEFLHAKMWRCKDVQMYRYKNVKKYKCKNVENVKSLKNKENVIILEEGNNVSKIVKPKWKNYFLLELSKM